MVRNHSTLHSFFSTTGTASKTAKLAWYPDSPAWWDIKCCAFLNDCQPWQWSSSCTHLRLAFADRNAEVAEVTDAAKSKGPEEEPEHVKPQGEGYTLLLGQATAQMCLKSSSGCIAILDMAHVARFSWTGPFFNCKSGAREYRWTIFDLRRDLSLGTRTSLFRGILPGFF